jgi:hypothetical protein
MRHVSMVPAVHAWLHQAAKTSRMQSCKAAARAHFGEFVKGYQIDDCSYMKQIEDRRDGAQRFNHGVWSVRTRFEPQNRFFGVFAVQDWFLVFRKQLRSNLKSDAQWHTELDKCIKIWRQLLPAANVYTGTELKHYVTTNASHCDARWY